MNHKVFISYSHADKLIAESIEKILDDNNILSFRDEKGIKWGEKIPDRVSDELVSCTALLIVVSLESVASGWVMLELGQAIAMSKEILPYLICSREKMPDILHNMKTISNLDDLANHFSELNKAIKKSSQQQEPDKILSPPIHYPKLDYLVNLKRSNMLVMKVPSIDKYSSFEPSGSNGKFLQLSVFTTSGFVPSKNVSDEIEFIEQRNVIYLICDPIRPFEIQVGETRTRRPGGQLIGLSLTEEYDLKKIQQLYPMIIDNDHIWMRMVLAELSDSEKVLDYIHKYDPDNRVKKLATRNPCASEELKSQGCAFCDQSFLKKRVIFEYKSAKIFPNDYPFGPYFHYIVLPSDSIHSWQRVTERHLVDMNVGIKRLFDSGEGERALGGSVGIRIGLNSSIRHLVMGKATATSAGASVPHVHKQVWGMAMSSFNLGDHLCLLCDAYEAIGIDYLDSYLSTIRKNCFLIWEDDNVALYIPIGQISVHELQIMVKRSGVHTFLDLTEDEIISLSKAEFIVTRLYVELDINSFNEVLLTRTFYRDMGTEFRLILTFITREVDLAVSELNLVYVVDKHPIETRSEIQKIWPKISKEYKLTGSSAVNDAQREVRDELRQL